MFFNKKNNKKKEYQSNSPLKKEDYRGNILDDDTDAREKTKQSIEGESQDNNATENIEENNDVESTLENQNHLEFSDLSEELDDVDVSSPLKRFLRKLLNSIKKKKVKKSNNYINNDLAPSLGNQGLGESSLTKEEKKRKLSLIGSISNLLAQNASLRTQLRYEAKNLRDAGVKGEGIKDVRDIDGDGKVSSAEKSNPIKEEHVRQRADAINDIGTKKPKGWVKAVADSTVKGIGNDKDIDTGKLSRSEASESLTSVAATQAGSSVNSRGGSGRGM